MLKILVKNLLFTKLGRNNSYQVFITVLALVCLSPMAYASVQDVIDIETTKIEYHDFYEKFTAIGQSRAENSKTYYAKIAGTIDSIAITQGQEVKQGDVLLTIDSEIAHAIKTKAEASFASAQSTYDLLQMLPLQLRPLPRITTWLDKRFVDWLLIFLAGSQEVLQQSLYSQSALVYSLVNLTGVLLLLLLLVLVSYSAHLD
jgi:multidrug efflux pump subunit AcrA (membrane-fusion protein)